MPKTKKFPSSLRKDGKATRRSEFVIPFLDTPTGDAFIGLKTGLIHDKACLSYIGTEIGVQDVLEKLSQSPADAGAAAEKIAEFLRQLQAFKIGNVLSIHYEGDGTFTLRKEADRPPGNKVPLP